MNRPCATVISCPCTDNPLGNFSAEAPDPITYRRLGYPIVNPNNPIGPGGTGDPPVWFAFGCESLCISTINQEDADLCAAAQAFICDHTPPDDHPPQFFFNSPQSCSLRCDVTQSFFWFVPGGRFPALTQEAADEQAQAYACEQAALHAFCMNDIDPDAQTGTPYGSTIFVSGAGSPPFTFTKSSGTLPPGLVLTPEGPLSTFLHGTPTLSGTYTFTITATDRIGIAVTKQYTITVTSTCSAFWTSVAANWVAQTSNAQCAASVAGNLVTVSAYIVGNTHLSAVAEETNGFPVPTPPLTDSFQCTLTVTPIAITNVGGIAQISINVTDFTTPAVYLSFTGLPGSTIVLNFTLPPGAKPIVDIQTTVLSPINGLDSQVAYAVALG